MSLCLYACIDKYAIPKKGLSHKGSSSKSDKQASKPQRGRLCFLSTTAAASRVCLHVARPGRCDDASLGLAPRLAVLEEKEKNKKSSQAQQRVERNHPIRICPLADRGTPRVIVLFVHFVYLFLFFFICLFLFSCLNKTKNFILF